MDDKERKKIKQIIIRSLENGATKARACAGANIGRETLYRWMEGSKSFKRDVEVTVESQIGAVEDALYKIAVEGNVAALKFFLCNRAPEKWKNTRSHKIESPEEAELTYAALIKAKKERERGKEK